MLFYPIISIIISVSCIFMGNFIYYRNPHNQLNQLLAIFSLFIGYMAFTDFGSTYATTSEQAYWWIKAAFPWMFVAAFWIHIALLATEKFQILEKKLTYVLIYLPATIFAILNLTTNFLTQGVQMGRWGWTYIPSESNGYTLVLTWTAILVLLSGILVLYYYLKSAGLKRQQAKYIFIGVNLPIIISLLTEFILPALSIPAPSILNLLMALGIGFIVYGMAKYKLPQLTSPLISDRILSTMSNFLFLLDEDGKILLVNFQASKLSGYNEKELLGRGLEVVFPKIDYSVFFSHPLENVETIMVKNDKGEVPVIASSNIIKTGKQDILGLVLVGSDITDLKETERERDVYREHLEELVEERTRELEETNIKLRKEISAHERAEKDLKDSLKEKEILVKEIHHRVKNNLMIISSLLNLQSTYIEDEVAQDVFKESENRAKSMAMIHERLYQSTDLKNIDFGDYIRNLTSDLYLTMVSNPERIKLDIDVEDMKIDINTVVPLGLIVNELVTNSMKYAFPDDRSGKIKVQIFRENEKITLKVSDNGIGFPKDMDYKNTNSLGLQLVNNLTMQIKGELSLERNHGTTFILLFEEEKGK